MREIFRPRRRPPSAVLPRGATTQPGSLAPVVIEDRLPRGCECRRSHRRIAYLLNVRSADGRAPSQSNRQSKAIATFSYGTASPATPNGQSEIDRKILGYVSVAKIQILKSQGCLHADPGVRFRVPPRCPECSELGSVRLQAVIRRGAATVYWQCRLCHAEWPIRPADYLERRIGLERAPLDGPVRTASTLAFLFVASTRLEAGVLREVLQPLHRQSEESRESLPILSCLSVRCRGRHCAVFLTRRTMGRLLCPRRMSDLRTAEVTLVKVFHACYGWSTCTTTPRLVNSINLRNDAGGHPVSGQGDARLSKIIILLMAAWRSTRRHLLSRPPTVRHRSDQGRGTVGLSA
jgi:hypothetical protein